MKRSLAIAVALAAAGGAAPSVYAEPLPGQWDCAVSPSGGWACAKVTADGGRQPMPEPAVPAMPRPAAVAPQVAEPPPETVATPEPEPEPQAAPVTARPAPTRPAVAEAAEPPAPATVPMAKSRPSEPEPAAEPAPVPTPVSAPVPTPAAKAEPTLPRPTPAATATTDAAQAWTRPWALCDNDPGYFAPLGGSPAQRATSPAEILADEAEIRPEGPASFRGSVVLDRADQHLEADTLSYDQQAGAAEATGRVRYQEQGLVLEESSGGWVRIDEGRGEFKEVRYRLPGPHGRGSAELLELSGEESTRLKQVTYTTCDAERPDWEMSADQLELDHTKGVVYAHDTTLRFKGMPVFYAPWMRFSLDDRRKSGLLTPKIGNSDATGLDLGLPIYWNIAPDRDATFTPHLLGSRGLLLKNEFRYLNPSNYGQAEFDLLPDDDERDGSRGYVEWRHQGHPSDRLSVAVDYRHSSDRDYLAEFGGSLNVSSASQFYRSASFEYDHPWFTLSGGIDGYQVLDKGIAPINRPYYRLPYLNLASESRGPLGLDYRLDAEYVEFSRDGRVEGSRLHLLPEISKRWGTMAYYLEPALRLDFAQYDLNGTAAGQPASPRRSVPILSLDGGMFFERDGSLAGRAMRQTLEPRAYYLYTKEEQQTALPNFDTGNDTINGVASLFRFNRFSGGDRVGDANQLALGLTSRWLDEATGAELVRAAVGQIYYFDDRHVGLAGTVNETRDYSDIVAELGLPELFRNWYSGAVLVWDPDRSETESTSLYAGYRDGPRKVVNLDYRFDGGGIGNAEQTDLSFAWPLSPRWAAVGRWNHSWQYDKEMELLAGLEYQSCCWGWRVVARRYLTSSVAAANTAEYEDGIYLQVVFKGLGGLGNLSTDELENSIRGLQID